MVNNKWFPSEDSILKKLWTQKEPPLTTREIAERMGRKRNSVIGRAHRLKLPLKKKSTKPSVEGRAVTKSVLVAPKVTISRRKGSLPPLPLPSSSIIESSDPIHIDALSQDKCPAVMGRDHKGRVLYCGNPATHGSRWCDGHHRAYTIPLTQKQKKVSYGR